jgi:hypothetical protein
MELSIKKFKSFVNSFNKIKKFVKEGAVDFDTDYSKVQHGKPYPYDNAYTLKLKDLHFKNVGAAYFMAKEDRIETSGLKINSLYASRSVAGSPGKAFYDAIDWQGAPKKGTARLITQEANDLAKAHKSMRFIPKSLPKDVKVPYILQHSPIEVLEGNHTYRIITTAISNPKIITIGRDDDPYYDYLDKGFFIMGMKEISATGKVKRHLIITNELDVHTMHIYVLAQLQPKLCMHLKHGCFVHSADAQMTRLKMEKKLSPKLKNKYDEIRAFIEKDYQSNTSLLVINKIKNKDIEKASINSINISKKMAKYENITIEADDLLDVLYDKLNFGGEFDIYSIIETYTDAFQAKVDEIKKEAKDFPVIKVNGFDINASVSSTGVRRINGKRINKEELKQVIYRASCHHSLEEYNLFVNRISKMSIRWHDAISNGAPIKIHSGMNFDEQNNATPSSDAPSVKFWIDPDAKCIKIRTADKDGGKVRLGKLLDKIDLINRKTNGRWSSSAQTNRDWRWARKELANAIRDCCTFTKVTKKEDGTEESFTWTTVTKDDILKVIEVADEMKKKAIIRSKEFLESAVKVTGAEMIEFLGKKAYKVKGSLREYAIVVENAKVYDYNTKQYRCIVNDNHFRGAGYDDIAARLYVLKNDSVMQDKIGTLKGEAQPQYENAHNNYEPERDVTADIIDQLDLN